MSTESRGEDQRALVGGLLIYVSRGVSIRDEDHGDAWLLLKHLYDELFQKKRDDQSSLLVQTDNMSVPSMKVVAEAVAGLLGIAEPTFAERAEAEYKKRIAQEGNWSET